MGVWYCTREDVKSALDSKETARDNAQVDRAIESASRAVESSLNRFFYPRLATRYFNWPNGQYARAWRLWLDEQELISVSALSSAGVTIPSGNYFLEPANTGPPFRSIELDLADTSTFGGGSTHQRDITVTGLWGYSNDTVSAGALAEALDTTETGVDVTNSTVVGVGDLITVESERMLVTGKTMLDTTVAFVGLTQASAADDTLAVADGTVFSVGEVLRIDTERVLVVDIAGNTLVLKRAWDGTRLAAHTSGTIYAPRTLTVTRGALGTTAASHSSSTAVSRQVYPGPVIALCVAEAINTLGQEQAGYAYTAGTGQALRTESRSALQDLRTQAQSSHGRNVRTRAV